MSAKPLNQYWENKVSFINLVFLEIKDVYKYRKVVETMVSSTLKTRYKRSVFGIAWSMLGPLINYTVIGFLFSLTAKFQVKNFFIYAFSGAVIYNYISTALSLSVSSLVGNESYIKKIYLPKSVYILSSILMESVNFLLSTIALFLIAWAFGALQFDLSMLFLPFSVFLTFLACFGAGLILSIAGVFFRDLLHVVPILLQSIFFLTPVFYPISAIPEKFHQYLVYNPFYIYIQLFREPIYSGKLPPTNFILSAMGISLVLMIAGLFVLKKFDNRVVFKL